MRRILFDSHGINLCKFQSLHTIHRNEKGVHMEQRRLFICYLQTNRKCSFKALGDPGTSLCKLLLILLSKTKWRTWLKLFLWSRQTRCQWSHCRTGQSGVHLCHDLSTWYQKQTLQSSWEAPANMGTSLVVRLGWPDVLSLRRVLNRSYSLHGVSY